MQSKHMNICCVIGTSEASVNSYNSGGVTPLNFNYVYINQVIISYI